MSKLYNIYQVDKKILNNKGLYKSPRPCDGWLKTIRITIGMTAQQLAKRLGVSARRVAAIEDSEVEQKLKLETLANAAHALGCDLHYILVPREGGLLPQIEKRALEKARQSIASSGQHMSLEDQLASEEMEEQARLLAQDLLHDNLKALWDE